MHFIYQYLNLELIKTYILQYTQYKNKHKRF